METLSKIMLILSVLIVGGWIVSKIGLKPKEIANMARTAPPNTMLGSAEEANKRFEKFEELLGITLQKAVTGEAAEPMFTENIDAILKELQDRNK